MRAKAQADDWVWIIDHTVQLGQEKCLLILGVRLRDLPWAGEIPLKLSLSIDPAFVPIFDWTKMQYSVLIEEIDLVYL